MVITSDDRKTRYEVKTRQVHGGCVFVEVEKSLHEDPPNGWIIDGEHAGTWDGVSLTGLPHIPHDIKAKIVRGIVLGVQILERSR